MPRMAPNRSVWLGLTVTETVFDEARGHDARVLPHPHFNPHTVGLIIIINIKWSRGHHQFIRDFFFSPFWTCNVFVTSIGLSIFLFVFPYSNLSNSLEVIAKLCMLLNFYTNYSLLSGFADYVFTRSFKRIRIHEGPCSRSILRIRSDICLLGMESFLLLKK